MGQALYRKYRSKTLNEIVGQEHITDSLERALKQGRISHAYLFTGPRGVGKTSIARILAHEINNLPYTDDSTNIDIIEIDAASNRRIDEIRELRETVYVAPTSAKYKVYIIDEVHMLTKEAFNALLKTLEEPPAHVVFILATTDAHKLPDTIISRTQRFSFKPVEKSKVAAHLKTIAKNENIKITDQALELLAEHGEGSFRDSISLLDQASSQTTKIEAGDVEELLGLPSKQALTALMNSVLSGAPASDIMSQLQAFYDQGFQAGTIAKQLSQYLRRMLVESSSNNESVLLDIIQNLINVPAAYNPERFLEITLLKSRPTERAEASHTVVVKEIEAKAPTALESLNGTKPSQSVKKPVANKVKFDDDLWPQLLQSLKQRHNTLYGVVRMAKPIFEANTLKLAFAFPFHQKRLNEPSNRLMLSDTLKDLTGQDIMIECIVDPNATPPKIEPIEDIKPPDSNLSAISNIFGNAELLES